MSVRPSISLFDPRHLPQHLREVSEKFEILALAVDQLPANTESDIALRHLLDAKDAAVRAVVIAAEEAKQIENEDQIRFDDVIEAEDEPRATDPNKGHYPR